MLGSNLIFLATYTVAISLFGKVADLSHFLFYVSALVTAVLSLALVHILLARLRWESFLSRWRVQEFNDRLQDELATARNIQMSLLPATHPEWPGLDVVCYSQPAREVGGDFYAYRAFPGGRFDLAVGDVSGKGMPAALLMAVSISSLQFALSAERAPTELLAQLDAALTLYTKATRQNTALCYAEIKGNILRVANAGCIAPFVRHASGLVEWANVGGVPLGVGLGAELGYSEATLEIAPGDTIILTSDGGVEATAPNGELFGFERLERAIATAPAHNAQALLAYLLAEVAAFVGEVEPHDDLTVVVARVE